MKNNCASIIKIIIAIIMVSLFTSSANAFTYYTPLDLGTLGGIYGQALDINNLGHVVGCSTTSTGYTHAFLWTSEEGMMDLGTLPGHLYSQAIAINDLDQAVGFSFSSVNPENHHAFLWTRAEGMRDLGTPGSVSMAFGINNLGHVIGGFDGGYGGFFWTEEDGMTNIGGSPRGINDYDQVVGIGLWTQEGGWINLDGVSWARDINNLGQVVGTSGNQYGVLWTEEGGVVDLGNLGWLLGTEARSINNSGQIVGNYNNCGMANSFIWENGVMWDINKLIINGGYFWNDASINDAGQIVGHAFGRPALLNPSNPFTPPNSALYITGTCYSFWGNTSILPRILIRGWGFGNQRSGMIDEQDGYYSFVTFTGQPGTMIATLYPLNKSKWSDYPTWSNTNIDVNFNKLFIDRDGDYLQDVNEPYVDLGTLPHEDYLLTFHTLRFHDTNGNKIYDQGDVVYDFISSNSETFTLTEKPVIYSIAPIKCKPESIIKIKGINFGVGTNSAVHIGKDRTYNKTSARIKKWTASEIDIKIPFGATQCSWFTPHADGYYKGLNVWITVNGVDSNKKQIKVMRPTTCP